MQPAPIRLQQAIRTAFRAARPVHISLPREFPSRPLFSCTRPVQSQTQSEPWQSRPLAQVRFYSNDKKTDIDRKVEDAKQRIDDTLDSRADNAIRLPGPDEDNVKRKPDETIIHTLPESSSIVYNPDAPGETAARGEATLPSTEHASASTSAASEAQAAPSSPSQDTESTTTSSTSSQSEPLPSQLAARYSQLRAGFSSFMDNFQTHIFTASRRLNDLTGYSSIEQLKLDIEQQEHQVRQARQNVKDTRDGYQAAIATRSDTQREVNDLLHRKHAWSSTDLERFTSLYRSDHANEQAETKAQTNLTQAEAAYEEATTKLSKSILARYHEEQVWSDKIRQMSTWGTWGLMGLNVLLFIVFQILIEPWRRRRLVKGFEQKVQQAIQEQTAAQELRTIYHLDRVREGAMGATAAPATAGATAAAAVDAGSVDAAQGQIFEDGATKDESTLLASADTELPSIEEMAQRTQIEQAAESVTSAEVLSESQPHFDTMSPQSTTTIAAAEATPSTDPSQSQFDTDAQPPLPAPSLPALSTAEYKDIPFLLGSYTRQYLNAANSRLKSLFDERSEVVISQKDLTARVLEGAFVGAVGVACFFWAVGVTSVRGR